jgi:hypothetical protein
LFATYAALRVCLGRPAASDAAGATGYHALPGTQRFDWRVNDEGASVPAAWAPNLPLAYAALSSAGRDLLSALSWRMAQQGSAGAARDLATLCEPATLPPATLGASVLSLVEYEAADDASGPACGAPAHVDGGLLTLVASTDEGLEVRDQQDATCWVPVELQRGEVAVLLGATLAAATGDALKPCVHRVKAQPTGRLSLELRLRGAPGAMLPSMTVAAFEAEWERTQQSVIREASEQPAPAPPHPPPDAAAGDGGRAKPKRRAREKRLTMSNAEDDFDRFIVSALSEEEFWCGGDVRRFNDD